MQIRRITGFIVLSLFTAFFLAACGGGGGGGSAPVPVVTTVGASSINIDNAVLNGTVNPNGLATTAWFEWGTSPTLATWDNTSTQSVGAGTAASVVNGAITGLSTGTTYYFRAAASNSAGTTKGQIVSLTTASPLDPPIVQTFAADNISVSGATLHANVIPNGLATNAHFEWGTDNTFAVPNVTPSQAVGADNTSHLIAANLTGLTTGTKYFYRVVATNSRGISNGATAEFTTNALAPAVTTNAATSITISGAVLNGDVNPNGLATTYHFQWGTDNTFATFDNTSIESAGSGITGTPVTAPLTGLTLGTKYYFRITASNSAGSSTGTILNFTTVNPPPNANAGPDQTVYMLGASGSTEVTLNGTGSSGPSGPITSYQWTQTAGTPVTLSNSTDNITTFTAPILTYGNPAFPSVGEENLSFQLTVMDNRGIPGTDNVTITVKWAFLDNFSTDTTGTYTVVDNTFVGGGIGAFTYDSLGKMVHVETGGSTGLLFDHFIDLKDSNGSHIRTFEGAFSLAYSPVATYGSGGGIEIRIGEDFATCYLISTLAGVVEKRISGVVVDTVPFPTSLPVGDYFIKITFTPDITTIEGIGPQVDLINDPTPIPVDHFFVTTVEQDGYYDNIALDVVN